MGELTAPVLARVLDEVRLESPGVESTVRTVLRGMCDLAVMEGRGLVRQEETKESKVLTYRLTPSAVEMLVRVFGG